LKKKNNQSDSPNWSPRGELRRGGRKKGILNIARATIGGAVNDKKNTAKKKKSQSKLKIGQK